MQFVYDAENRQKEARDSGGFVVGQYFYDGEGRRVKKVSATETVVFVYDGGGVLVAEYSTVGSPTASVKYLTQDHLGSPSVVTDQVGNVVSRTDFGAFGEETVTSQRTTGLGYKADNVRQDYTGYEKDDESGLEYAQARYYNPAHGRFTSVDPLTASASIRNPQTFNRYSYVLNSPYKFTDPLGLISQSTGACGQCGKEEVGGGGGAFNSAAGIFDIYYLVTTTTSYTVSASRENRSGTFVVTVTEQSVQDRFGNTVENGEIRTRNSVSTTQPIGNLTELENQQVTLVAKTAAEIALKKGVDVGEFLGFVQGETEFGIARSSEPGVARKAPVVNPSQLSGGRARAADWGSPGYQSALEYNLEESIDQVYFWAQGQARNRGGGPSSLWWRLYYWNGSTKIWPGQTQQERVRFANRVEPIINGIQSSRTVSSKRTGYFFSPRTPTVIPLGQVRPCSQLGIC